MRFFKLPFGITLGIHRRKAGHDIAYALETDLHLTVLTGDDAPVLRVTKPLFLAEEEAGVRYRCVVTLREILEELVAVCGMQHIGKGG